MVKMKKNEYGLFENLKYIFRNIIKSDKGLVIMYLVFTCTQFFTQIINVIFPKFLISELVGPKRLNYLVMYLSAFFLIITIGKYILAYIEQAYFPKVVKATYEYIKHIEKKCLETDFSNMENEKFLDDLKLARKAVDNCTEGVGGIIHKSFLMSSSVLLVGGYGYLIFKLHPLILLYIISNIFLLYKLNVMIKKFEYDQQRNIVKYERKTDYIKKLMYDFSYGKEIRIYKLAEWITKKFCLFSDAIIKLKKSIKNKYLRNSIINSVLSLIRQGLAYFYLTYLYMNNKIEIGDFVMYLGVITAFSAILNDFFESISYINGQNYFIVDMRNFIEHSYNKIEDNVNSLPKKPFTIEFRNVSFAYPQTNTYVLEDFSLLIEPGVKLAIVGLNGAGKSTIVKLLCRLYEPTKGDILLNGVNINSYSINEYQSIIAPIFQDISIFPFSIYENIALTEDKFDKDNVDSSLQKSGLKEKFMDLKNGLDTSLSKRLDEDGIELSGGEKQKVALARALYKKSDIIILDEPTSALDPIAESEFYNNINKLWNKETVIYISHRLSSTNFCDKIILIKDKNICEQGTHKELMNMKGLYYKMYSMQSNYYKKEGENYEL